MTTGYQPQPAERIAFAILAAAGVFVVAHAFIPLDEFVHRTDDAFYYFKTAYNYPVTGFWSFDTIHPTNGVQPLWAWIQTAIAQVLAWMGIRDADLFARVVVGLTAVLHVASVLLLFRLLARTVSLGAAVGVAAALMLPLGIVWRRVWGMENSLYAVCLVATLAYYLRAFRSPRQADGGAAGPPAGHTDRRAVILGLLLGVTALARLNAVLLAICAVGALLLAPRGVPLAIRLRTAAIVAAVSASCVVPYLAWNYATTGHPLPISGAVKTVLTGWFLEEHHLESRFSLAFVREIVTVYGDALRNFVTWRMADGTTVVGGRILLGDDARRIFHAVIGLMLVLPAAFVGPRAWIADLAAALRRLGPLYFVVIYALANLAASIYAYPHQISNAMTKWWLVESELIIIVAVGTIVGLSAARMATTVVPRRLQTWALAAGLVILVAAHGQRMVRFYWNGAVDLREWNASWGEETLTAARWLAANVPADAVVGSWNAGVLGYYAPQRVTNLDGLINNFELLEYIRNHDVAGYIARNNIAYLSDMESTYERYKIHGRLKLHEVYRSPNPVIRQDYVIYKVER